MTQRSRVAAHSHLSIGSVVNSRSGANVEPVGDPCLQDRDSIWLASLDQAEHLQRSENEIIESDLKLLKGTERDS